MNDVNRTHDIEDLPPKHERDDQPGPARPQAAAPAATSHKDIRPRALWLLGLGALLPLAAGVAYGAVQRNAQDRL